ARRGIVIKDPAVLERIDRCRTAIFDKTGTLTYGQARLTEILPARGSSLQALLALVASLERYSRHPLAAAVIDAAMEAGVPFSDASEVSEPVGAGLRGRIGSTMVHVISRAQLSRQLPGAVEAVPQSAGGLECVVLVDGRYAGLFRFRDEPRTEG